MGKVVFKTFRFAFELRTFHQLASQLICLNICVESIAAYINLLKNAMCG